jgi:hypothetical protein
MLHEELEHDDQILIEALAAGMTHEAAAEQIGCSTKTVQRRLRNPAFVGALRERRAQRADQFASSLERSAERALRALDDLLDAESESVRLAAVRLTLAEQLRFRAAHELEERICYLEATAADIDAYPRTLDSAGQRGT